MGLAGASITPAGGLPAGRMLWDAPHPVWVHGGDDYRTVQDGAARLAVAGHCYATNAQLQDALVWVRQRRWAELTRWPGSYWAAATDGVRTAVAGDLAGARPVYQAQHRGGFIWATAASLLADPLRVAVDLDHLVAWLVAPTVPELAGDTTPYVGVSLVPAGRILELPAGSLLHYPHDPSLDEGEVAWRLREALAMAAITRVRAHGQLTCDLSGGLDSTSVAALAAHASPRRLRVFTHLPHRGVGDDVEFARRAAAELPGLIHRIVSGTRRWFDDLDKAPATDLPYADAARWAVHAEYLQAISVDGSDAHLTGGGGDTLFAPPSYALADLARAGRWRRWIAESTARARLRHRPVTATLSREAKAAMCSYPDALRRLGRAVAAAHQTRHKPGTAWLPLPGIAAWLTTDAAHEVKRRLDLAARHAPHLPGAAQAMHRLRSEIAEYGSYHAQYAAAAQHAGVDLHAPFLDNQVIRAILGTPAWGRLAPRLAKPKLAEALTGAVPPFILERGTKTSLAGTAYAGVSANIGTLRDLIASSALVDACLIDRERVEADLARLSAGVPGRMAALEALVSVELWLARPPAAASGEVTGQCTSR